MGLMVLGIFLANDSMASIDTRSMDGRIYVGDHKTYIYKLCVSPFQRKRFLIFSHNKSIHTPKASKPKAHNVITNIGYIGDIRAELQAPVDSVKILMC